MGDPLVSLTGEPEGPKQSTLWAEPTRWFQSWMPKSEEKEPLLEEPRDVIRAREVMQKAKPYHAEDYDLAESDLQRELLLNTNSKEYRIEEVASWGISFIIGIGVGIAAFFFNWAIYALNNLKFDTTNKLVEEGGDFVPAFFTFIGFAAVYGAVAGFLGSYMSPRAAGSGIPEIKVYLNGIHVPGLLTVRTLIAKGIGVSFSIASGLFVGKEGPFIHVGAILGSGVAGMGSHSLTRLSRGKLLGKVRKRFAGFFRTSVDHRDYVAAGTAAGVSAAFFAPFSGVLFAVEQGTSFFTLKMLWHSTIAAGVSQFTVSFLNKVKNHVKLYGFSDLAHTLLGSPITSPQAFSYDVTIPNTERFYYFGWELPLFCFMGCIGGVFGALLVIVNSRMQDFRAIYIKPSRRFRRVLEVVFFAVFTSSIWFLISFFSPCTEIPTWKLTAQDLEYGSYQEELFPQVWCPDGQYSTWGVLFWRPITDVLTYVIQYTTPSNVTLYHEVTGLLMLSIIGFTFMTVTNGIGAVTGLFVPSVVVGGAAGRLLGRAMEAAVQASGLTFQGVPVRVSLQTYAVVGSSAMLGGTSRMFLSVTFLIAETTGAFDIVVPLILATFFSKVVGDSICMSIYQMGVDRACYPFLETGPTNLETMKLQCALKVDDIMSKKLVYLPVVVRVRNLVDFLRTHPYSTFPLVKREIDPPVTLWSTRSDGNDLDMPDSMRRTSLQRKSGNSDNILRKSSDRRVTSPLASSAAEWGEQEEPPEATPRGGSGAHSRSNARQLTKPMLRKGSHNTSAKVSIALETVPSARDLEEIETNQESGYQEYQPPPPLAPSPPPPPPPSPPSPLPWPKPPLPRISTLNRNRSEDVYDPDIGGDVQDGAGGFGTVEESKGWQIGGEYAQGDDVDDSVIPVGVIARFTILKLLQSKMGLLSLGDAKAMSVKSKGMEKVRHVLNKLDQYPLKAPSTKEGQEQLFKSLSEVELDSYVNLEHLAQRVPLTLPAHASVARAYHLFKSMGLHHIVITKPIVNSSIVGLVTRKDLMVHKSEVTFYEKMITNAYEPPGPVPACGSLDPDLPGEPCMEVGTTRAIILEGSEGQPHTMAIRPSSGATSFTSERSGATVPLRRTSLQATFGTGDGVGVGSNSGGKGGVNGDGYGGGGGGGGGVKSRQGTPSTVSHPIPFPGMQSPLSTVSHVSHPSSPPYALPSSPSNSLLTSPLKDCPTRSPQASSSGGNDGGGIAGGGGNGGGGAGTRTPQASSLLNSPRSESNTDHVPGHLKDLGHGQGQGHVQDPSLAQGQGQVQGQDHTQGQGHVQDPSLAQGQDHAQGLDNITSALVHNIGEVTAEDRRAVVGTSPYLFFTSGASPPSSVGSSRRRYLTISNPMVTASTAPQIANDLGGVRVGQTSFLRPPSLDGASRGARILSTKSMPLRTRGIHQNVQNLQQIQDDLNQSKAKMQKLMQNPKDLLGTTSSGGVKVEEMFMRSFVPNPDAAPPSDGSVRVDMSQVAPQRRPCRVRSAGTPVNQPSSARSVGTPQKRLSGDKEEKKRTPFGVALGKRCVVLRQLDHDGTVNSAGLRRASGSSIRVRTAGSAPLPTIGASSAVASSASRAPVGGVPPVLSTSSVGRTSETHPTAPLLMSSTLSTTPGSPQHMPSGNSNA